MIKDIITKNESIVPGAKELEILKENFPACFSADGTFDFGRFKEYLNTKVAVKNEGYELRFLGKNYARLLASEDTTTVIVPDEEHNAKPENKDSKNIYITGDNLDGLKHLLKSYSRKVKCIYIDPPYNTGSDDFVYTDKFNFTVEELSTRLSIDEEQAKRVLDLTKRGSASHSAWLMFMYPRLLLARDLLSEDGVIFISIDDNEQANLKLLCDDVFGESNFIVSFIKQSKVGGGSDAKFVVKEHEYCLCYGKNINDTNEMFIEHNAEYLSRYKEKDDHGRYFWDTFARPGLKNPIHYDIVAPDGTVMDYGWIHGKERFESELKEGIVRIVRKNDGGWSVQFKQYLNLDGKKPRSMTMDMGGSIDGKNDIAELFSNEKIFSYPKSVKFISVLLNIIADPDSITLDFFSGSATTAHAVLKMNSQDGGQRRFIMIQIPETCKSDSEAYKAGFRTIDEIGRKRIELAAQKIQEENSLFHGDFGFKHYTLKEPEAQSLDKMEQFDPKTDGIIEHSLLQEFGKSTVLETWLVRDGYGFSAPVQELDLAGYKGYHCKKHLYLLDHNFTKDVLQTLITKLETDGAFNPEEIVLFGYNFTWGQLETLRMNLGRVQASKNLKVNVDVRY